MIDYKLPPEDNHRIVTMLIPDTTGKTCQFHSEIGLEGMQYLPLVGWASVAWFTPGQPPRVTLEPVVDDDCMGPVPLGELEEEVGPLKLIDIS